MPRRHARSGFNLCPNCGHALRPTAPYMIRCDECGWPERLPQATDTPPEAVVVIRCDQCHAAFAAPDPADGDDVVRHPDGTHDHPPTWTWLADE